MGTKRNRRLLLIGVTSVVLVAAALLGISLADVGWRGPGANYDEFASMIDQICEYQTGAACAEGNPAILPTITPILDAPLECGIFDDTEAPYSSSVFWSVNRYQKEDANGLETLVFAGADGSDRPQGVLRVVQQSDDRRSVSGGRYPSPIRAGALRIIAVEGSLVVTTSEQGLTFTFNIDTRTYISGPPGGPGGAAPASQPDSQPDSGEC